MKTITPTKFAKNLKRARRRAGLSQSELETRSQLARTWVSQMECGRRMPRLPAFARLVQALRVPAGELLGTD